MTPALLVLFSLTVYSVCSLFLLTGNISPSPLHPREHTSALPDAQFWVQSILASMHFGNVNI